MYGNECWHIWVQSLENSKCGGAEEGAEGEKSSDVEATFGVV